MNQWGTGRHRRRKINGETERNRLKPRQRERHRTVKKQRKEGKDAEGITSGRQRGRDRGTNTEGEQKNLSAR